MFLDVEAVASAVFSRAYRSAICSMLAFRVLVIEQAGCKGVIDTEYNCHLRIKARKKKYRIFHSQNQT